MDGWIRVRSAGLAWLLERGWQWRQNAGAGLARVQLVSPRGAVWDLRLAGGAWIRPVKVTVNEKKTKAECRNEF